jgi:hypothetical protein
VHKLRNTVPVRKAGSHVHPFMIRP